MELLPEEKFNFNSGEMMPFLVKKHECFIDITQFRCQEYATPLLIIGQFKTAAGTLIFLEMVGYIPCRYELVSEEGTPHLATEQLGFVCCVCHDWGFYGINVSNKLTNSKLNR